MLKFVCNIPLDSFLKENITQILLLHLCDKRPIRGVHYSISEDEIVLEESILELVREEIFKPKNLLRDKHCMILKDILSSCFGLSYKETDIIQTDILNQEVPTCRLTVRGSVDFAVKVLFN